MAHTLLAMADGRVLDWVPDNGKWRLWNYDPKQADILPGDPVQSGQWRSIHTDHALLPMVDGNMLDWCWTDGSWRLWQYDPTQKDILTGPIQQGQWKTIVGGHVLIPMMAKQHPSVLDWVPSDGSWRLLNYDPSQNDIFPGDPLQQGQWKSITTGHVLIPMRGNPDGPVLDWVPADGSWRLWTFDATAKDVLPGDPVQQGDWKTIQNGHSLVPLTDGKVLDWLFDGTWRLWNYDANQVDILPGDPAASGRWATISDIFWRAHDPITFDGGVPVGGWSSLVIRPDGSYEFAGHFHDSSALTGYDASDAWVVVNDGHAFSFAIQGHMGGIASGDSRDMDWHETGVKPELAGNWDAEAGSITYQTKAAANLDVKQLVEDIKTGLEYVGEIAAVL